SATTARTRESHPPAPPSRQRLQRTTQHAQRGMWSWFPCPVSIGFARIRAAERREIRRHTGDTATHFNPARTAAPRNPPPGGLAVVGPAATTERQPDRDQFGVVGAQFLRARPAGPFAWAGQWL